MTKNTEQWQQVKELFPRALELPSEQRKSFLRQECGHDEALFREVSSLLEAFSQAQDFLERPPFAQD